MALPARAIKSKIRSIGNIRKITRAMEMVSVSKMKKAVAGALATREYAFSALDVLADIADEHEINHPLLEDGAGEATLVVMVASNKGLCGGFNASLSRAVLRSFTEGKFSEDVRFVTIGVHAERFARKVKRDVRGSFVTFSDVSDIAVIRGLMRLIFDEFSGGSYRRVVIAYNNYVSAIRYVPTIRVLLPLNRKNLELALRELGRDDTAVSEKKKPKGGRAGYLFEPNEESVLREILPRLAEVQVYQALLESVASEHSARMFAMKQATESAGKIADELTLRYNQARQSGITQELSEIAAGMDALT